MAYGVGFVWRRGVALALSFERCYIFLPVADLLAVFMKLLSLPRVQWFIVDGASEDSILPLPVFEVFLYLVVWVEPKTFDLVFLTEDSFDLIVGKRIPPIFQIAMVGAFHVVAPAAMSILLFSCCG